MSDHETALAQGFRRLTSEGSRREFLRLAGLLGGALAVSAAAACSGDDDSSGTGPSGALALDFTRAVDVLTYAFALEALEADFYTKVVGDGAFATAFTNAGERQLLTDIRDHEVAHREFLRAAIGAAGGTVPALAPKYPGVDFTSRSSVLATAKTFEDTGVSAYNGAGKYLVSRTDLLTIAGKIVSVEARHASAIRDVISPNSASFADVTGLTGADETKGLDAKATPAQVLSAVAPFISQTITATGL